MKVLWQKSPLTLGEVVEILDNKKSWSKTTVRTMLGRLMDKGFVDADKTQYYFKFFPTVSEYECVKNVTESFLNKAFNGSVSMMVATLIKDNKITKDELSELKEIIEQIDKMPKK